jgi:carbon monoxide dehydrogenase subunit G
MELAGQVDIAASRASVWAALNDPDVLARCIDGVERLVRTEGTESGGVPSFEGEMNAKVGPVRARFAGTVRLEDIVAPERYRLVGEGKGGIAGFAKGGADVALAELGPALTRLDYVVKAQVGGKLAQLGARLIEGTARQYAESFFAKLKAEVEAPAAVEIGAVDSATAKAPESAAPVSAAPAPAAKGGLSPLVWGGGLILAVMLFLAWQWNHL